MRRSRDPKVDALRRVPLFEDLSNAELGEVARLTDEVEIPAGTAVIHEGSVGHEVCVIVDGEAEVTKGGERLATSGAGDFFGEIALLEGVRRTATVTAKTPLRCFVLSGQSFTSLLDSTPAVERKILRTLGRRLRELSGDPTLS